MVKISYFSATAKKKKNAGNQNSFLLKKEGKEI